MRPASRPRPSSPNFSRTNPDLLAALNEELSLAPPAAKSPLTERVKKSSKKASVKRNGKSRLDKKLRHKLVGLLSLTILSASVLGYLVYLNLPDISARVSAIAVGIDTTLPSYIPNGYRLEGLPSVQDGRVVFNFTSNNDRYTITKERSSLSTESLGDTIISERWPDATTSNERGLTIYINGHDAKWVHNGVLFTVSGSQQLTARQIHNLAVSMQ
ncbi:hypothetical protein FWH13_02095 [Candidatus Saccharibacteria bacterium]|nr:hypothetical protein [Candidatus Saccharibacteria bacterium]